VSKCVGCGHNLQFLVGLEAHNRVAAESGERSYTLYTPRELPPPSTSEGRVYDDDGNLDLEATRASFNGRRAIVTTR
jgi:hypothetical protein